MGIALRSLKRRHDNQVRLLGYGAEGGLLSKRPDNADRKKLKELKGRGEVGEAHRGGVGDCGGGAAPRFWIGDSRIGARLRNGPSKARCGR